MNKIKKLFLTVLGAVLFVCMGVAVAACGSSKKTYYSVQTEYESSQGTVSLSPEAEEGKYEEGTEVTVTVTPKSGYTVGTFTVNGEGKELSDENTYQFTVEGDTTIAATFTSEQTTPKQFTLTKNVPENGTVEVTPAPGEGGKYAEGTELTVTLTPAQGYEVGTFTVNGTDKKGELQDNVYTFHITGETTIAVEFTALEDFLDGKTIYSFDGYAFSFENKKATLLMGELSEEFDYVVTAEGIKFSSEDYGAFTFTKNADGTVTMTQKAGEEEEDEYVFIFYFLGKESTITVGGVVITFTIEAVEYSEEEYNYEVTFGETCKFGETECYYMTFGLNETETANEFTLYFDKGPSTYKFVADYDNDTTATLLSSVTLKTQDGDYELFLDYSTDNSHRLADLYKVIEGGKESIGKATRQDVSGVYSWVFIVEDGSTTTTYTVTITGAVWGETAAQDDYTNAKITVTTESASALEDFLTGKTLFSLVAQKGYTFADGKATALATGSVAEDYVITSETTATIGEDVTLTKNEDGSVTIDEKTYFFVGVEVTLTVKEGGADVNVVFTIQKVDVQNTSGIGDEYEVTFGGTTKYGDNVCTEVTVFGGELTLTYVDSSSKYAVTVDLSKNTATKALSGVSLLTDDQEYRLDITTGSANRLSDFYKKSGSSYTLVASSLARQSREVGEDFEYYWEATETDGDATITYTIDITGAKWGNPASLDKYSDAKITVTKVEKTTKTLTATGSDNASYEVTFMVDGTKVSITTIKKDSSTLYNPKYFVSQKGEFFDPESGEVEFVAGGTQIKYTYTKTVYDASGSKDHTYELTIKLSGESVNDMTMSVEVKDLTPQDIPANLKTKTVWTPRVTAPNGDGYEGITVQYDDNNKVWGITGSFDCYLNGGGYKSITVKSSTVQDLGNNEYIVTADTTEGELKFKIVVTDGPNFTITVYEG